MVEYHIHIREIAKLEVEGLKTELTVGEPSAPFGVTAYDKDGKEFDTLDGIKISWYLGAKRAIAEFDHLRDNGPVCKVIPVGAGKGSVIAMLVDSNYAHLSPGSIDISVQASLMFEPDNVVLLQHGKLYMKVRQYE